MPYPQYDHLGRVIDRWDTELTRYPYIGSVTADGYADVEFASARSVRGMVRPGAALDFEIANHGRVDEGDLLLLIRNSHGLEEHDRIIFDGEPRRAVEQEIEYLNDFSLFTLKPDGRQGGGGSDSGDAGGDNPFEPI